jgi:hypothetical protein
MRDAPAGFFMSAARQEKILRPQLKKAQLECVGKGNLTKKGHVHQQSHN